MSWNLEFGESSYWCPTEFQILDLQMPEMAEGSSDRQKGIRWSGISHQTTDIYFFF